MVLRVFVSMLCREVRRRTVLECRMSWMPGKLLVSKVPSVDVHSHSTTTQTSSIKASTCLNSRYLRRSSKVRSSSRTRIDRAFTDHFRRAASPILKLQGNPSSHRTENRRRRARDRRTQVSALSVLVCISACHSCGEEHYPDHFAYSPTYSWWLTGGQTFFHRHPCSLLKIIFPSLLGVRERSHR